MLIKLKQPFSLLLAGPSSCGKSTFVCNLLTNVADNIDTPMKEVHWCYAEENARPTIKCEENGFKIFYHVGIPESFANNNNNPILIILDDLMNESGMNARVSELFTKGSHHRNISIILITQNIFHKGSHSRDISLNAKYIVLFKNPRDRAQAGHLFRQIYPEGSRDITDIYRTATEKPYSYLLIDLTQTTNDLLRFRSDIFNPYGCACYSSKRKVSVLNKNSNNNNSNNEDKKEIEFESNTGQPIYSINPTIS